MNQTEFGEPEDLEAMLRRVIREETGLPGFGTASEPGLSSEFSLIIYGNPTRTTSASTKTNPSKPQTSRCPLLLSLIA